MLGTPQKSEAPPYYFTYIDRIADEDIVSALEKQSQEMLGFVRGISDERSLHRYASDKWSIRQVLSHISDCERLFVFRAFWFGRGFDSPLPSFDQNIGVAGAGADGIAWSRHVEEFQAVRLATLAFVRNLPEEAWMREGVASGNRFSVRAMLYLACGHVAHHRTILEERY